MEDVEWTTGITKKGPKTKTTPKATAEFISMHTVCHGMDLKTQELLQVHCWNSVYICVLNVCHLYFFSIPDIYLILVE